MATGVVLPDNVLEATEDYLTPEQAAKDSVRASWFRELLKGLDSRLDLIFVKPGSRAFPHSPRFYIVRDTGNMVPQYWVIQDENGEYCVPEERHFERFCRGDANRNPQLHKEFDKVREDRMRRARYAKEELRREFREKLLERLEFIENGRGLFVPESAKAKLNGG